MVTVPDNPGYVGFQPGDRVTISHQTTVHIVDHVSYMPEVVRVRCGKLGFAHPAGDGDRTCRKCERP